MRLNKIQPYSIELIDQTEEKQKWLLEIDLRCIFVHRIKGIDDFPFQFG